MALSLALRLAKFPGPVFHKAFVNSLKINKIPTRHLMINSKYTKRLLETNTFKYMVSTPCKWTSTKNSHSALWTAERLLSFGLVGVIPLAFLYPYQHLESLLALSVVMHQHWGLEAIITDYIRPILFGNAVPKIAHGLLFLFSAITLGGLFYFIYTDIGIVKTVKAYWAVKGY